MAESRIAILGAGMAGLGAAHRLRDEGLDATIYDKKAYPGGHAASFVHGDFTFDDGPHVSFTKDKRVQELFAQSVGGRYEILQTRVDNYWRGHWIKHPAQCNLHGLPSAVNEGGEDVVQLSFDVTSTGRVVNLNRLDENRALNGRANRLMRLLRRTPFRPRFEGPEPVETNNLVRNFKIEN